MESVLLAVEQIPPGRVVSYGDLAGLVGTGPRLIGTVLSRHGGVVPWWRVTNATGDAPVHLLREALSRWAEEGIVPKPNGRGCRIAEYRADLARLADDHERATAAMTTEISRPPAEPVRRRPPTGPA